MPWFSMRLGVLGIELQRRVELLQRAIGLSRVVVADAQIGARVRVRRIDLEALLVPLDGVRILLGVEVGVGELHGRARRSSGRS